MASSPSAPDAATRCPTCGAQATGKFCSNCAAPLAGATCLACNAPLSPGAKFCHRCGTRVGSEAPPIARTATNIVPWSIAGISLLAVVAFIAAQRFSGGASQDTPQQQSEAAAPPSAAGQP